MKLVVIFALAASQGLFETLKATEAMQKHAHLETTMGEIVLNLLPEKAPNHVGYFIKMVEEDAYDHTSFHRVIKYGIIQGGDPKTKDTEARQDYGTGGLGLLARELNDEKHSAGAVSAVQIPGRPNSAGSQFFVVVTEQVSLDGQYTVFARVVEGMRVVQKISNIPADENGKALLDFVLAQDMVAWWSQGELTDRSKEKLGRTDTPIILMRRQFEQQMRIVEDGGDPMNVCRAPATMPDVIHGGPWDESLKRDPAFSPAGGFRSAYHRGYGVDDADRYGPAMPQIIDLMWEIERAGQAQS